MGVLVEIMWETVNEKNFVNLAGGAGGRRMTEGWFSIRRKGPSASEVCARIAPARGGPGDQIKQSLGMITDILGGNTRMSWVVGGC